METTKEETGDRVRALRAGLGLSQEAAAKLGGILRTELSTIERGHNKASSYEMRVSLSQAFGLSLEDLDAFLAGRIAVDDAVARSSRPAAPKELPAPKVA